MPKKVTSIRAIDPELVDNFARVRIHYDAFRPTANLHDKLWARVHAHLADHPNGKPATLKGNEYVIEIDACQTARAVMGVAAVYERLKSCSAPSGSGLW
jgi:hypothetical protein